MNTVTRSYPVGGSCPWRIVAPAWMTPIARTLEAARTRPNVRAMLAAEAAKATSPQPKSKNFGICQPLTYHGHEVDAPGFTQDQFDRAMVRAFVDDLEATETDIAGRYMVGHRNTGIGYHVTRERCGCKAGTAGTPCKHRALLIAHLDIRQPAVAKEWSKLYAESARRQAVA